MNLKLSPSLLAINPHLSTTKGGAVKLPKVAKNAKDGNIKPIEPYEPIRQIIYGNPPSKSNSYRVGKNGIYTNAKVIAYSKLFVEQCDLYRNKMIDGNFGFIIDVYYKTLASDLDGVFKIVLDLLQRKVFAIKNDNKCLYIYARKFKDKDNPRIEFEIKPIL